ncbi:MAG TPA: DUF6798 domain-containing protein [Tepidisphaeraceae bacterium]|nr:DUF6798 domain-containing protein [Tepidisphaeraceae bacterium]
MTSHVLSPALAPPVATTARPEPRPWVQSWRALAAVAFGSALALAVHGYQFGKSNHGVYLLDAMRDARPELLANDWFTTQTLQYHAAFGLLTRVLYEADLIAPVFLAGYLALIVLLHVAWWRMVRALGGGGAAFVVSAALFYLLAGGTGLGMYQFLQDSAFLPSNIAAVAMLWAIALWLGGSRAAAGACLGVAGLFHLNFALVGVVLWGSLNLLELRRGGQAWRQRWFWIGSAAALLPSLVNIALALRATASRSNRMPLAEFVDLYVRLRHPHHYDPSSWPAWLWITFALPLPLAALAYARLAGAPRVTRAWREAALICGLFALMLVVALLGAGLTFVSETLVQASLYRFSIFPKLLACAAAALLITDVARARSRHAPRAIVAAAAAIGAGIIAGCVHRGPYLGLFRVVHEEPAFVAACASVRARTPVDAVFVVPPNEQDFRLGAQRAVVVDFKGVPQLSAELSQWRDRLQAVLDLPDLRVLPRPFPATLRAIRDRYQKLPPEHLAAVARRYGARYLFLAHRLPEQWEPLRVDLDGNTSRFLYDLDRQR